MAKRYTHGNNIFTGEFLYAILGTSTHIHIDHCDYILIFMIFALRTRYTDHIFFSLLVYRITELNFLHEPFFSRSVIEIKNKYIN